VRQQIADLTIDQSVHDRAAQDRAALAGVLLPDELQRLGNQLQRLELAERDQSELHRVVGIVCIVGNAVGQIDDLHFQQTPPVRLPE
jgi:hypothetical protein